MDANGSLPASSSINRSSSPSNGVSNNDGSTNGNSSSNANVEPTIPTDSSNNNTVLSNDISFNTVPTSSIFPNDISFSVLDASSLLVDVSLNISLSLLSDNSINTYFAAYDPSCVDVSFIPVHIVDVGSTTVTDGSGYTIVTQDGYTIDGSYVITTTFQSTDPSFNSQITENLTETFSTYDDVGTDESNSETFQLMQQIKVYANEIKCSDFHGKGTIDDYTELFKAASQIANETKQMELNVDIEGFNEFASAADSLSDLFNGFIIKLNNVNIITDVIFLRSIVNALSKIVNLSSIFKKFKEVVFATSQVEIPKSTHDTSVILQGVMAEINCAVEHIQYFVNPTDVSLNDAQLSDAEKNMISKSVDTIKYWNVLCDNGVNISMAKDEDIKFIQQSSNQLKIKAATLHTASANLKQKLNAFHIKC